MSHLYYWHPGSYYLPLPSQPVNYVYGGTAAAPVTHPLHPSHAHGLHPQAVASTRRALAWATDRAPMLGSPFTPSSPTSPMGPPPPRVAEAPYGHYGNHSSISNHTKNGYQNHSSPHRAIHTQIAPGIQPASPHTPHSISSIPHDPAPHSVRFRVFQPESLPPPVAERLNASVYPAIEVKKYSTAALDPARHFLTVFEYPLNGHSVIWDYESGYVHLTGIWKAAIHHPDNDLPKASSKADIVKLLESTPRQHQSKIKRIRGGFLKIQGTWLHYLLCRFLARRFCYHIRYELVPVFGPTFPNECFLPTDAGYGELKFDDVEEPHTPPREGPVPRAEGTATDAPPDLSYNEVVDIVNASKCLQSLSQCGTSPSDHVHDVSGAPVLPHYDPHTSPISGRRWLGEYTPAPARGISSILLAADLSSNSQLGPAPQMPRRASVKINDLLS